MKMDPVHKQSSFHQYNMRWEVDIVKFSVHFELNAHMSQVRETNTLTHQSRVQAIR